MAKIINTGIESVPLQLLKPHPRNVNQGDFGAIQQSVETNGFYGTIVANKRTGHILAGNHRYAVAKAMHYTDVPVAWVDVDDEQELRILIADNRTTRLGIDNEASLTELLAELAATPTGLTGTGFDGDDLDALISSVTGADKTELLTDPDEIPEDAPTRCNPGDLWQLGRHRLICGDSTDAATVERLMGGARPSLMITDPPYGVEYDPNWRNDAAEKGLISYAARRVGEVENDGRVDWQEAWALFPGDVVYCWHADRHASEVQQSLAGANFEVRSQIIWAKNRFAISRGHYHWQHEPCWYAVRKGATADWIGDRSQTTLWQIPVSTDDQKTNHGTQKPVECMKRPMLNHAGDVYEPFCGSGTTVIAAELVGRTCYAVELSPAYCDVILKRWEDATGETATLLEAGDGR